MEKYVNIYIFITIFFYNINKSENVIKIGFTLSLDWSLEHIIITNSPDTSFIYTLKPSN